jgi:hypothetical protein
LRISCDHSVVGTKSGSAWMTAQNVPTFFGGLLWNRVISVDSASYRLAAGHALSIWPRTPVRTSAGSARSDCLESDHLMLGCFITGVSRI